VNTDFAETEADIRQVNLTRFPLFFPEKRTFFLEGAGVFDVAGLANTTDIRPFFSRRIGLVDTATEDSVAVPLRVGAKLTGRQSDYNIGVIDVETGSQSDIALPGGSVSPQNLMAEYEHDLDRPRRPRSEWRRPEFASFRGAGNRRVRV
jgi:hypothetical protein